MSADYEELLSRIDEILSTKSFGKYRGLVKELGSGAELGLLRVSLPEIYGANALSPFCEPCVPLAGDKYGFLMLPKIDDWVWIDFIAGDRSKPVWSGFVWTSSSELPAGAAHEVRVFTSTKKNKIVFDDNADKVHIEHHSGAKIILGSNTITLEAGSGKIELSSAGVSVNDGALEIS